MSDADPYNIDTYSREVSDGHREAFPNAGLRVGVRAPAFQMPLVDGGEATLESLLAARHVVLIFGCFSAPPMLAQLPALETLHRTYGGRSCAFLFVYTREIHPGEKLPPHRSMKQKLNHARRMRDHARITFPVAADDLAGTVHLAYGALPSMACVVHRDGTLVYRGSWTQATVIQAVLENLLLRDQAKGTGKRGRLSYHEWIAHMEWEADEVWALLDLAGPKARADHERANRGHPPALTEPSGPRPNQQG